MTISYNWLNEYFDVSIDPQRLSEILTSIGLEVESMEHYESIKGSLEGLVIGEVLTCEKHPNADKLTLTTVNVGYPAPLQIVCGAPNVAVGQKVIVAPVGSTIYPSSGEPVTMKPAKIRGVESQGMICAEDEIGLGESHAGILVLPPTVKTGTAASDFFQPYKDIIYEIGLTPNRMDAMSHLGVARDVAAYISYHDKKEVRIKTPYRDDFPKATGNLAVDVIIENKTACRRYAGVSITNVKVAASPTWLKEKLKAIGVRSINNIVDITNYILHESGQPLHAFDADAITGRKVIVKNLPEGTPFLTLDEKERKVAAEDLMICNEKDPMCFAGVFGGLTSGVKASTTSIFLESAWFNPTDVRKTSFRHALRTDAATRFEKGIDISNTVKVLQRAALMITELAGGEIASEVIDVYPEPAAKREVALTFAYLRKLSGKNYHNDEVTAILNSLGFEKSRSDEEGITVKVPFHKLDVSIPADLVEEILRIDGYDHVAIPQRISITPAVQKNNHAALKEKIAASLVGSGFNEIMTNSITNSAFFSEEVLGRSVKMLNSLSNELDIMRPSLLETGLQAIAYNLNRRNLDLAFFEFGRAYSKQKDGGYVENDHLALFMSGMRMRDSWKRKGDRGDFYSLKGITASLLNMTGISAEETVITGKSDLDYGVQWMVDGDVIALAGAVSAALLNRFDIRQPVFYSDMLWSRISQLVASKSIRFTELPRQLPVHRDLSMVVPKRLAYQQIQTTLKGISLKKLKEVRLFDLFESEKLGADKKSMAVSFDFLDEEKTLTDKEVDGMMSRIVSTLEKECQAEIRK